ncbi:MAG: hypothetical protein CSB55_06840 [Candidatus Cloacimonadota bacterium]|nr:MAG: hypothetical protein CSB55_06840 [Candidatus Cloacimonadota bacterium]
MKISAFWIILLFAGFIYGMEFSGFADTYFSAYTEGKFETAVNYQRIRGNFYSDFDNSFLFVSLNGKIDNISGENKLNFHELYLDYADNFFNIRFGKQLTVWGNADGVRITDLVCPSDLNELTAQEFDDIRKPLNLARLKSNLGFADLELIWIPLYEGDEFPRKSNPYRFEFPVSDSLIEMYKPDNSLENGEVAGKLSFFYSYFDFSFSWLNVWNDFPVFIISDNGAVPYYYRSNIVGAEISKPVKSSVIRLETATFFDHYFNGFQETPKHKTKAMLGWDYYPGNTLNLSVQYINEKIWDYEDFIAEKEEMRTGTFNIKVMLFRETLQLGNMIYYSFDEEDLVNNFSVDYAFNDNISFLTGFNYFNVNNGSVLNKKSQIWVKSKVSF